MISAHRILKILGGAGLALHLGIRLTNQNPAVFADLILFNLVGFIAMGICLFSPGLNDPFAKLVIAGAIGIWTIGSTISTWDSFYNFQIPTSLTDYAYAIFYPLMLAGIIRALTSTRRIPALELLDTLIIALGTSGVISSLLLRPAMLHFSGSASSIFLSIFYPVGDVVLAAVTISLIALQRKTWRTTMIFMGVTVFAISDLYFLLKISTFGYSFGAITDDGWILGLLLIALALSRPGGEVETSDRFHSIAVTISLIISSLVLAIAALRPNYFPSFVLIPCFATITLAFLRMAIALKDARSIGTERELARTDELTGLPNRRKFLTELELLKTNPGTLLLLDLDGFKSINDRFGHAAGDQLLKQISIRFARVMPEKSILARLGGDEFGAIIFGDPELGKEIALALIAATTYPFQLTNQDVTVGVSIGRVDSSNKYGDLMRLADEAMYLAKPGANP